jgi:hypothetical protein
MLISGYIHNCNERDYEHCLVTDKGIKNQDKDSKYLIYTKVNNEDIEVFEIEDSFVQSRWNSSDIYAQIEIGKTYTFKVVGIRDYFWSLYPNIIEWKEEK